MLLKKDKVVYHGNEYDAVWVTLEEGEEKPIDSITGNKLLLADYQLWLDIVGEETLNSDREDEPQDEEGEEKQRKIEAEKKEQERLTGEAKKFKDGAFIKGEDVVELCRRYGIKVHLRTVHNLQQVVNTICGKSPSLDYHYQRGTRTPKFDGCYKAAKELYAYLQTHDNLEAA